MQRTIASALSIGLTRDPAGVVVSYILPPAPQTDSSQHYADIDAALELIFPDLNKVVIPQDFQFALSQDVVDELVQQRAHTAYDGDDEDFDRKVRRERRLNMRQQPGPTGSHVSDTATATESAFSFSFSAT